MVTTCQLLLRGLDGRTSCLRFPSTIITGSHIQEQIATIFRLPVEALLIVTGTALVHPHSSLSANSDGLFPSCTLIARLRGGKGGFGSLLRGAATKAGQKKTSNFDACRDMSGRRLRHVNAEKKLKEWKAQANERELEKAANEFLKKQVKRKEEDSGCSQVIEKFREETSRARDDVESAVASGLAEAKRLGKRKVVHDGPIPASSSKRQHIWLNSDIDMIEDDDEDKINSSDDEEDDDNKEGSEVEDGKEGSVYVEAEVGSHAEKGLEDGNHQEGHGLVKAQGLTDREDEILEEVCEYAKADEGFEARSTYKNTEILSEDVEAENPSVCKKGEERLEEDGSGDLIGHVKLNERSVHVKSDVHVVEAVNGNTSSSTASFLHKGDAELVESKALGINTLPDSAGNGLPGAANNCKQTEEILNLDDFAHASNLEVLGFERLKHELQMRGLKCGGSLAERAGRLFLLKSITLEKLDKKHFAKPKVNTTQLKLMIAAKVTR